VGDYSDRQFAARTLDRFLAASGYRYEIPVDPSEKFNWNHFIGSRARRLSVRKAPRRVAGRLRASR